jgi:hypothetical protein
MRPGSDRGLSRRDFVAAAVAIGGSSALSACLDREGSSDASGAESLSAPSGTDPENLPESQHVWNQYLVHGPHGNTMLPNHQLVLGLSYTGSMPPTDEERAAVAGAMDTLDRAFRWGTGSESSVTLNEGLLSMIGYSPSYFEAMGEVPEGLMAPADVLEAVGEDPSLADGFDAIVILNSDLGSNVLAAEEALLGERDEVNGVAVEGTFEDVFEVAGRRTGVVGPGNPAAELGRDDVPEDAPLSMGFRSGFADNQAAESTVTIADGAFAGGTTLLAARLRIDLDRWYEQSEATRIREMFSPQSDPDQIDPTADRLGSESEITEAEASDEGVEAAANEHDMLGHTQKVARARNDDFEPTILRRTEGVVTDEDFDAGAGFNFHSVQRDIQDFVDVRKAMNVDEYDVDVPDERHGIIDYLETRARGTFLVPPRSKRALPTP